MRVGDIVRVVNPGTSDSKKFNYGLIVASASMHYDNRYRMWDVLVEGSVKNVSESWMVAVGSK
jgi:hypothetical protein